MSEQEKQWEARLQQQAALDAERSAKLKQSPENDSPDLIADRQEVERLKQLLDQSIGNPELHDQMTTLAKKVEAKENDILDGIEPGYSQRYNEQMAALMETE